MTTPRKTPGASKRLSGLPLDATIAMEIYVFRAGYPAFPGSLHGRALTVNGSSIPRAVRLLEDAQGRCEHRHLSEGIRFVIDRLTGAKPEIKNRPGRQPKPIDAKRAGR